MADAKAWLGNRVLQRFNPLVDLPGEHLGPAEISPGEIARLERGVLRQRLEHRDGVQVSRLQNEDLSERVFGLAKCRVDVQSAADVTFRVAQSAVRVIKVKLAGAEEQVNRGSEVERLGVLIV